MLVFSDFSSGFMVFKEPQELVTKNDNNNKIPNLIII